MNQSHSTIRHRLSAAAWGHLARTAGTIDRWSRRPAALAVGAVAAVSGLLVVGAEHSASHPVPALEARPGPGSAPALAAYSFVDHLAGITITGSPKVLEAPGLIPTVAEVEVPAAPHPVVVVVDHVDGPWRVVDHWTGS